jgi:hypothetical protein
LNAIIDFGIRGYKMKKTLANTLILFVLFCCFANAHVPDGERSLEKREVIKFGDREEEVLVFYPAASANITRRYQTTTMCEILGFLNDYDRQLAIGARDDFVEHFYPSEKEKAERFNELLKQFVAEAKLDTEIKRDIRKGEGEHITFRSRELAQILNSFYTKTKDATFYSLDTNIFDNPYPKYKLAFLRGAHTRYGEKGRNMFHVSYTDYDVIVDLLRDVHCMNIRYIQEVDKVPSSTTIVFRPTDAVKEHLGITTFVNIFLEDTNPDDRGLANTSSVWRFKKNDNN